MKKRAVTVIEVICLWCMLGAIVQCENIVTYSDEYISFEYDADFLASIECYDIPSDDTWRLRLYSIETAMEADEKTFAPTASITISRTEPALKSEVYPDGIESYYNSDRETQNTLIKRVEENEIMVAPKDEEGMPSYGKLLYCDENTFITAMRTETEKFSEQSEFAKHIYDTVSVVETYGPESYVEPEDGFYYKRIASNVLLSKQAVNYANEAVRIIEAYLAFEVDEDTSKEEMEELYGKVERYAEQSEYVHDADIKSILFLTEYDFDGNSDIELLDTVDELKMVCRLED